MRGLVGCVVPMGRLALGFEPALESKYWLFVSLSEKLQGIADCSAQMRKLSIGRQH